MEPTTRWGQCFLCERESRLFLGSDRALGTVYICRTCGGMNNPTRIEARIGSRGKPLDADAPTP
jgi:hypothetical protein